VGRDHGDAEWPPGKGAKLERADRLAAQRNGKGDGEHHLGLKSPREVRPGEMWPFIGNEQQPELSRADEHAVAARSRHGALGRL